LPLNADLGAHSKARTTTRSLGSCRVTRLYEAALGALWSKMKGVATFLLVWNPDNWPWPDSDYDSTVALTDAGHSVHGRWSVGIRRQGIVRGDRAYLVRQHRDRGLVGSGEFSSKIYEDEHWDGSGRDTTYADLTWNMLLPVDDRIPVEVLKAKVPGVSWDHLQGSGVLVSGDADAQLDRLWAQYVSASIFRLPEEPAGQFPEGAVRRVEVNRYERDRRARAVCIAHHGTACSVCGFDFEKSYGRLGRGFIHVHHLTELSTVGPEYKVDPIRELRPICPNCHAMVHREVPALSIAQLRRRLRVGR
jgi:5-methylcytosine-specific restriction enzyme A